LLADTVSDNDDLKAAHKTGVNVMYSNGAGLWVMKDVFWKDLKGNDHIFNSSSNDTIMKTNGGTTPSPDEVGPNGQLRPLVGGVWYDLDRGSPAPVVSGPQAR
jgi:hypothetical protein